MAGGGTISITAANLKEAGADGLASDFVRLSVADTGCGMSSEVLARVFEPFFTTKDVGKGSGLGLPQVYGFAQQSGGRLTIDSREGVGTVVTLLLPRSSQAAAASAPATPAGAPAGVRAVGRHEVLLVEDDVEVAALTREMLAELGYSVVHAGSPAAALGALANSRSIDVVFSDIMMPGGMSGLDLAREIRRRHPALPVVLTTGYSEASVGMASGEFPLLLKPYSLEGLSAAMDFQHERIA
jgi:CheY-like chemotaxis protein